MPENLTDRNRCHKCDKTGKRKKDKLSKCARCHAVTYCSRECQVEDWARHKENCVPVMVTEVEGKGRGLVAARDIKMGELILIDKAVVSSDALIRGGYDLTPEAERMLLNQKIFKDISLLNHSCAPNAAMGLLDGERNKEQEKRFELRATKNISKEDEVTIFYPWRNSMSTHAETREMVHKDFGFDCKCLVCLGQIPNQDDIMWKIRLESFAHGKDAEFAKKEEEKTLQDWKKEAIVMGVMSDLAKPLYMGRETEKIKNYFMLFRAAMYSHDLVLMKKAHKEMEELADNSGLESMRSEADKCGAVLRDIEEREN